MRRIRLTVAYDGTDYCGWQIQPNGITIEEVLNKALFRLTGEPVKVVGASRTDAGVHALGNTAVFDTDTTIPPERIAYALNRELPADVVAVRSEEVPLGWHPRRCSSVKTYRYLILNREMPNPLMRRTSWHVSYPLDVERMRQAAQYLTGEHDFRSFCSVHTEVTDTVRTIYDLDVRRNGEVIRILVRGSGFLYNMVRIMAGTLTEVGRGLRKPENVKEILEAKEREKAGATAPPWGLTLMGIEFPTLDGEGKECGGIEHWTDSKYTGRNPRFS